MTICKIARMGHPVLSMAAKPVDDPTAPAIAALIRDMLETMADADGTGLAAPQIHIPLRVVIYMVEGVPGAESIPPTALINPQLTPLDDDDDDDADAICYDWERCLSVPGLTGLVPRWRRIGLRAQTPDGGTLEREAEGFHARVLQHECDHLDGILYPARMDDLTLLMFAGELRHGMPEKAMALMQPDSVGADNTPA